MIAAFFLAAAAVQQSQPMVVVRPEPLASPLAATSWSCNFSDANGKAFFLEGRFDEIPVNARPDEDRETVLKGVAASQFLGAKSVRAGRASPNIREYSIRTDEEDGSGYNFNFKFLRNEGSYATVSRYTPPSGDKIGVVAAYANGYCSSRFHEIGETESGQ